MSEHPIHFLRDEIMSVLAQMKTRSFNDSEQMKTVIDLACENIIEHFRLDDNPTFPTREG
jgi:hypothetical protein